MAAHEKDNRMPLANLAILFAPTLRVPVASSLELLYIAIQASTVSTDVYLNLSLYEFIYPHA